MEKKYAIYFKIKDDNNKMVRMFSISSIENFFETMKMIERSGPDYEEEFQDSILGEHISSCPDRDEINELLIKEFGRPWDIEYKRSDAK